MKEEGMLLRSSIVIDLSKIGYQGKAFLAITNSPGQHKTKTTEALRKIKNVFIVTETVGEYDLIAVAAIKDFKNMINLINEVRKIPSVDQVDVALTASTAFPIDKEFPNLLA